MLRALVVALVAMSLLAHTAVAPDPAPARALQLPAGDFDQEDFAGLIVLHVHSDGRLHLHVHLLGTHEFFLPFSVSVPPAAASVAQPQPQPAADSIIAPIGRDAATSTQALGGRDTTSLFLGGGLLLVALAATRISVPELPARRGLALAPLDPPPRAR